MLFLSDFNETGTLSTNFRKLLKYETSCQSVQWEPSCSMLTDSRAAGRTDRRTEGQTSGRTGGRTDGRTDMTKVMAALRNFANATKKRSKKKGTWK